MQVAETARGTGGSVFWSLLRARTNESFATDVVLTARRWTGRDGTEAGVVNQLAQDGGLLTAAEQLGREVGTNPQLSVRAAVKSRRAEVESVEVAANARLQRDLHLSPEYQARARASSNRGGH